MHFLSTLAPLALLLTSTVDASGHGHKRNNRHGPAKRAAVSNAAAAQASGSAYVGPTAAEVYEQDATALHKDTKRANAPRKKRSTCSSSPPASANATTSVINVNANVQVSASVSASASKSASKTSSSAAAAATTGTSYNSGWKLDVQESGNTFFDNWDFWSYDDPTHGTVDYVSRSDAWNQGLVAINPQGNAIMAVDTTNKIGNNVRGRKSVRIHSKYTFNGGLIIMDAVHMPTGCGTWPAWWANGPNWPNGGEIDILEGVNGFTQNQVSIHTGTGCTIPADFGATSTLTTGNYDSLNCDSYATANQGCGQRSTLKNAYGVDFNNNGGGVYAMKWDTAGIAIYFFPREAIPADITAGQPTPASWGKPMGNFPSTSCDPFKYFTDNFAIFDTTFCGDWAGNTWQDSGYAGQTQSCAAKTGYSTCSSYVRNEGAKFTQAYWEIKSVKYYQPKK